MAENPAKSPVSGLNPNALTLADAAHMFSRVSGQTITPSMLQTDIEDGAPTNADGTINLVHFAAWLVKEMAIGD